MNIEDNGSSRMTQDCISGALERMERRAEIALKHTKEDTDSKKAEGWKRAVEHYTCAAEVIKEIQKYWAIGTIVECQEARERQTARKITHESTIYKCCTCPNCKNVVDEFETIGDAKMRVTFNYCHFCGQKLDWSD